MDSRESSFLGNEEQPVSPPSHEERNMALLSHVLTLIVWIIAPLVIYLVKKDESGFVAAHAKESLNFQITIVLVGILMFISIIGIFLLWILGIIWTVLVIVATIKASEGKMYRYPLTLRLIK